MVDRIIITDVLRLISTDNFQQAIDLFKRSPVFIHMNISHVSNTLCGRILEGRLQYCSLSCAVYSKECVDAARKLKLWLDLSDNQKIRCTPHNKIEHLNECIRLSMDYMEHVVCEDCTYDDKLQKAKCERPLQCECQCTKVEPIIEHIKGWQNKLDVLNRLYPK